jgi:hypothetical protein
MLVVERVICPLRAEGSARKEPHPPMSTPEENKTHLRRTYEELLTLYKISCLIRQPLYELR